MGEKSDGGMSSPSEQSRCSTKRVGARSSAGLSLLCDNSYMRLSSLVTSVSK
jgi:hypothetical protein